MESLILIITTNCFELAFDSSKSSTTTFMIGGLWRFWERGVSIRWSKLQPPGDKFKQNDVIFKFEFGICDFLFYSYYLPSRIDFRHGDFLWYDFWLISDVFKVELNTAGADVSWEKPKLVINAIDFKRRHFHAIYNYLLKRTKHIDIIAISASCLKITMFASISRKSSGRWIYVAKNFLRIVSVYEFDESQ